MKSSWLDILGWNKEQLEEIRFAGFSYFRQGLYTRAILYFEGLVVLDPNNAYDNQTLGALYLQVGKNQEALSLINRALEIDPLHEPTLLNKTKALLLLGQREEGLAFAKKLESSSHPLIANDASALVLAYT